MVSIITDNKPLWLLLAGMLFFAIWSPTGVFVEFPKYWHDEAFALEQARTFLELGRLDITVAPNTPSDMALALSANGPMVSLPLAGVFSVFGIGLVQARAYMLVWLLAVTVAVYLFLKNIFDVPSAIAGTLLMATFASFYANGRTVTGEIPGFLFAVIALYLFICKRQYFWSGLFFALAMVTKTSSFHIMLPAAGIALIAFEKRQFLLPAIRFGMGVLLIISVWLLILLPQPYSVDSFTPLIEFYRNPTHKTSVLGQFSSGIPPLLYSSTIGYFSILAVLVGISIWQGRRALTETQRRTYALITIYILLQTIVFLRSPGWIRYLLQPELFILLLLFPALSLFVQRKFVAHALIGCMAVFQSVHYVFFSNILPRPDITPHAIALNKALNENPEYTIGFVDAVTVSAFVPSSKKFNYIYVGGSTYAGIHPLTLPQEEWPDFMYSIGPEYEHIQERFYKPYPLSDGSIVFRKK